MEIVGRDRDTLRESPSSRRVRLTRLSRRPEITFRHRYARRAFLFYFARRVLYEDNVVSRAISFKEERSRNRWFASTITRAAACGESRRRIVRVRARAGGWGRNNVFRRRHFYRAPSHPAIPGLLLFPMLYVNCTVKSHYIRAQCIHYIPCQKHFYPLEFFSFSIHSHSPARSLLPRSFFFLSFPVWRWGGGGEGEAAGGR